MKRALMTALSAAIVLGGLAGGPPEASADNRQDHESKREAQCRFQWLDEGIWTPREEWRTAVCVTSRWSVPGGLSTFTRIIGCESGWNRKAFNPSGPYVGLGQHALSAWSWRWAEYAPTWWRTKPDWQNSRSMLTVTARMMNDVGLSPWSCA